VSAHENVKKVVKKSMLLHSLNGSSRDFVLSIQGETVQGEIVQVEPVQPGHVFNSDLKYVLHVSGLSGGGLARVKNTDLKKAKVASTRLALESNQKKLTCTEVCEMPCVKAVGAQLGLIMGKVEDEPVKVLESLITAISSIERLKECEQILSIEGNPEYRVKKMSGALLSADYERCVAMSNSLDSVVEAGESTILLCWFKACELNNFSIKEFRSRFSLRIQILEGIAAERKQDAVMK
jgi:hypothetical protein